MIQTGINMEHKGQYTYRNYLSDLTKFVNKANVTFFLIFILFIFYILIRAFDSDGKTLQSATLTLPISNYIQYDFIYWIVAYGTLVASLFGPISKIRSIPYLSHMFWAGTGLLLTLFFVLVVIISLKYMDSSADFSNLLLIVITITIAIAGWFVQHQISSHNSRTGHTLNVLLQMRLSEEFQSNARIVKKNYPNMVYRHILKSDVSLYFTKVEEKRNKLEKEKMEAIASQIYLLNYYEFLAYGIKSKSLDEELLYQVLRGVIDDICKRSEFIIEEQQRGQQNAFKHILELSNRWKLRYNHENQIVDASPSI